MQLQPYLSLHKIGDWPRASIPYGLDVHAYSLSLSTVRLKSAKARNGSQKIICI